MPTLQTKATTKALPSQIKQQHPLAFTCVALYIARDIVWRSFAEGLIGNYFCCRFGRFTTCGQLYAHFLLFTPWYLRSRRCRGGCTWPCESVHRFHAARLVWENFLDNAVRDFVFVLDGFEMGSGSLQQYLLHLLCHMTKIVLDPARVYLFSVGIYPGFGRARPR